MEGYVPLEREFSLVKKNEEEIESDEELRYNWFTK